MMLFLPRYLVQHHLPSPFESTPDPAALKFYGGAGSQNGGAPPLTDSPSQVMFVVGSDCSIVPSSNILVALVSPFVFISLHFIVIQSNFLQHGGVNLIPVHGVKEAFVFPLLIISRWEIL